MSKRLPYKAMTERGNQFEFEFPLHPETGSSVDVFNLLTAVLGTLDREVRTIGPVSNGDVLQALAMALAVRTRILPGNPKPLAGLATRLLNDALAAPVQPDDGNVAPDEPRDVH